MDKKKMAEYWRKNLSMMVILLSIWGLVSYVFGILLVDVLNHVRFGGFKLGFWFAQQGSIYVFVCLIFVYCSYMKKLDIEYDVHE
jgi:putative solute:sodium symporter small subunit